MFGQQCRPGCPTPPSADVCWVQGAGPMQRAGGLSRPLGSLLSSLVRADFCRGDVSKSGQLCTGQAFTWCRLGPSQCPPPPRTRTCGGGGHSPWRSVWTDQTPQVSQAGHSGHRIRASWAPWGFSSPSQQTCCPPTYAVPFLQRPSPPASHTPGMWVPNLLPCLWGLC